MQLSTFIAIGENIHCTRTLKRDGDLVLRQAAAPASIIYLSDGIKKLLPIPETFQQGADWANGKIKHCAVAIWQGLYGQLAARAAGVDYLQTLARKQARAGAAFLDINVDEFSMDLTERIAAMEWTIAQVQPAVTIPLSIDSANLDIMRAGLRACDRSIGRPMLNSISLERLALLDLLKEYQPAVIASAAGAQSLPANTAERLANLESLIPQIIACGIELNQIFIDPLVYTISTDPQNGKVFLESVRALRQSYGPSVHIVGGLSNVSFGMPSRKLINQVFSWLMVQAGGDGGIVDPLQINAASLRSLDMDADAFKLASALLNGQDEYGLNYIAAYREGRLG